MASRPQHHKLPAEALALPAGASLRDDIDRQLWIREEVSQRLSKGLKRLEGGDRKDALRTCRQAGIPATELAKLAGISRARLYQLLGKEN